MHGLATRAREERGQAVAEFAIVMPILAALLLAIIQFGILFNNWVTLTDATRNGVRKAAVSRSLNDGGASAAASVRSDAQGLDQTQLGVTVTSTNWTTPGSTVTVTSTYPYSISILGFVVQSGLLTSSSTERLE